MNPFKAEHPSGGEVGSENMKFILWSRLWVYSGDYSDFVVDTVDKSHKFYCVDPVHPYREIFTSLLWGVSTLSIFNDVEFKKTGVD